MSNSRSCSLNGFTLFPHLSFLCVFVLTPLCHLSSLWPWGTVEKWLRLCGRHPGIAEKPASWPAEPPDNHLRPWALTPLDDHQDPDDEPEEEVDPHCRLRGRQGGENTRHTHSLRCGFKWCFLTAAARMRLHYVRVIFYSYLLALSAAEPSFLLVMIVSWLELVTMKAALWAALPLKDRLEWVAETGRVSKQMSVLTLEAMKQQQSLEDWINFSETVDEHYCILNTHKV